MKKIFFLLLVFCATLTALAEEQKIITADSEQNLAGRLSIILPGMNSSEVRKIQGLLKPYEQLEINGQEVWHYNSPREQKIYFKNGRVERVEYSKG